MITVPRRLLMTYPGWESNICPAPTGTVIRYGNMETEPKEEVSHIGSYPPSIVPNRFRTALVYVYDIVAAGHVVTFTHHHENIVSDVGSAYTLRIPRVPDSREWLPTETLHRPSRRHTSSTTDRYTPMIHPPIDNSHLHPRARAYTRYLGASLPA